MTDIERVQINTMRQRGISSTALVAGSSSRHMGMLSENTAPMNATFLTGSEVALMNKDQAGKENRYSITMSIAASMVKKGIITTDDYRAFEAKMREKYKPSLGDIFGERVPE